MDGVKATTAGTVGVIALDAPNRNALTPALCGAIEEHLRAFEADATTTAVVFASDGPTFCSGADLNLLRVAAADPVDDEPYAALGLIYRMFETIQRCAIPTIAAVSGPVVGAGMNLPLSCDLRVVSDDVTLTGFGKAGVHAGGGHLSMLTQRVGRSGAAAISLFGQTLDAQQAVACGFAHVAVPAADLRSTAVAIAGDVGKDKPLVLATTRSFRAASAHRLDPEAAVQLERAPQIWSLRRRFGGSPAAR